MNLESFLHSRGFRIGSQIVFGCIVVGIVFSVGVFVGQEKASFFFGRGLSYNATAGGSGLLPLDRNFVAPHGSVGKITQIEGNNITLQSSDGTEKNIVTGSYTTVRTAGQTANLSQLKVNDSIVVVGSPDSAGATQAKFIRILTNATN